MIGMQPAMTSLDLTQAIVNTKFLVSDRVICHGLLNL